MIKFLDNKLLLVNIIIDNDIKEVDSEIDFFWEVILDINKMNF